MEREDQLKFGERFPELTDTTLELEEMDFSVRTYNGLKRAKIQSLTDLLTFSLYDLMKINCRDYSEVIEKLKTLKEEQKHVRE